MRVLVVAAHPDDEVLGCGAAMARLAASGHEVHTLILGEGVSSRPGQTQAEIAAGQKILYAASERAVRRLTDRAPRQLSFPDNRFDSVPLLEIVQAVEVVVDAVRPHTVFTHFGGDLNVDHRRAFQAVLTAVRPIRGGSVRELFCFETPSATEWAFGRLGCGAFQPDLFLDVSDVLEAKLEAFAEYEPEMRVPPHPRSLDGVRSLAELRGSQCGVDAAEAFETVFVIP